MSQDELKQHLDAAMGGVPLVNPDEQHKYLGTFRERCYLTITIQQMTDLHNQQALITEFKQHSEAFLLLNGAADEVLQQEFIHLATKNKLRFTIINDYVKDEPDSFGAILAAKTAVNEAVIDVAEKYPLTKPETEPEKGKEGFWQKLFH